MSDYQFLLLFVVIALGVAAGITLFNFAAMLLLGEDQE
jgi:hypothetical protein